MAKQTIGDLCKQLHVPEYAQTFEHIASHAPVTFKNGSAHYTLENDTYTQGGALPDTVEEWKTLYFDIDTPSGRTLAGLVLPMNDRVGWQRAADELGVQAEELRASKAAPDALPLRQRNGSCGPWVQEGHYLPVRLIFDEERALWADLGVKTGWKLPGDENTSVYTTGIEAVYKAAARTAEATLAGIRKL